MLVGDMMKGQSPEEEALETPPPASRAPQAAQAVPKAIASKVEESSSDDAMVELSAGAEDKELGFDVAQRDNRQPLLELKGPLGESKSWEDE